MMRVIVYAGAGNGASRVDWARAPGTAQSEPYKPATMVKICLMANPFIEQRSFRPSCARTASDYMCVGSYPQNNKIVATESVSWLDRVPSLNGCVNCDQS
jgi:hypothetical protein